MKNMRNNQNQHPPYAALLRFALLREVLQGRTRGFAAGRHKDLSGAKGPRNPLCLGRRALFFTSDYNPRGVTRIAIAQTFIARLFFLTVGGWAVDDIVCCSADHGTFSRSGISRRWFMAVGEI